MKKILSILMVVTIVAAMLVLPASAASASYNYKMRVIGATTFSVDYNYNTVTLPYFDEYENLKEEWPYAIMQKTTSGGYQFILLGGPLTINNSGFIVTEYQRTARIYNLSADGTDWVFSKEHTYAAGGIVSVDTTAIWSNFDIKDADGEVFLPGDSDFRAAPLAEMILGVAEEQMTEELPVMGQTMKILLLCGVGLMTLLVALPLLRTFLMGFLGF